MDRITHCLRRSERQSRGAKFPLANLTAWFGQRVAASAASIPGWQGLPLWSSCPLDLGLQRPDSLSGLHMMRHDAALRIHVVIVGDVRNSTVTNYVGSTCRAADPIATRAAVLSAPPDALKTPCRQNALPMSDHLV